MIIISQHWKHCTCCWAFSANGPDMIPMWLYGWKWQRPLLARSAFDSQLEASISWLPSIIYCGFLFLAQFLLFGSFFLCSLSQSLHCIKSEGWVLLCRWMLQENTPGVSHSQFPACLADFLPRSSRGIPFDWSALRWNSTVPSRCHPLIHGPVPVAV